VLGDYELQDQLLGAQARGPPPGAAEPGRPEPLQAGLERRHSQRWGGPGRDGAGPGAPPPEAPAPAPGAEAGPGARGASRLGVGALAPCSVPA